MKLLVKLGGTLLDGDASRAAIAAQVAAVRPRAPEMVLVHGGGRQMTRFLAAQGVESRFVNGLRVTTGEVIDAVLKIFTGTVNRGLVASLVAAGVPAVGLSGIDANLVEAEQLDPKLGAVGKPVRTNARLLETLVAAGFLPVVACVAGGRDGAIYNVNADQMAVSCAAGYKAERIVFLTDVEGVRDGSGVIRELTPARARRLIRDGIATGGMQAKLEAAIDALSRGVREVAIAPGAAPRVLERLLDGDRLGTRIVEAP